MGPAAQVALIRRVRWCNLQSRPGLQSPFTSFSISKTSMDVREASCGSSKGPALRPFSSMPLGRSSVAQLENFFVSGLAQLGQGNRIRHCYSAATLRLHACDPHLEKRATARKGKTKKFASNPKKPFVTERRLGHGHPWRDQSRPHHANASSFCAGTGA